MLFKADIPVSEIFLRNSGAFEGCARQQSLFPESFKAILALLQVLQGSLCLRRPLKELGDCLTLFEGSLCFRRPFKELYWGLFQAICVSGAILRNSGVFGCFLCHSVFPEPFCGILELLEAF